MVAVVRCHVGEFGIGAIRGFGFRLCGVLLVQERVLINSAARYLACLAVGAAIASCLASMIFTIHDEDPNPQR
jgi:hypothetical protein